MPKIGLGMDVLTAARQRIAKAFDDFPKIYLSYSGGKDSTVMLHLVMEEAIRRNRKIGLLFIDLEAQYKFTIEHIDATFKEYGLHIEPFWVSLPIHLRNAVSQFEPQWVCWEPGREADWVRTPPKYAITDQAKFPFYTYAMEFEEFIEHFGHWYGNGQLTCCFVGIRSDESLNRFRAIAGGSNYQGFKWTTWKSGGVYNAYPIYDWRTEDIWTYHGKFPEKSYNKLYDRMHRAGLTIHQARICQPYGDDQRRGLWLYHVIEPETWSKIVARVNGANQGALYASESGNILGRITISKPEGHTWESFAKLLLESLPPQTREHYENKISVFLNWYHMRGFQFGAIPDDGPTDKSSPSWKRICKMLLKNDYWAKSLSFSPTKSTAYFQYKKIMKKRRAKWSYI
jgi:predicted phosphoadenosine phosphosulfate sulfurtransferase